MSLLNKIINDLKNIWRWIQGIMTNILPVVGYNHIEMFYNQDDDNVTVIKTHIIAFEYKQMNDKDGTKILHPISMFNTELLPIQWDIKYAIEDPNGNIMISYIASYQNIEFMKNECLKEFRKCLKVQTSYSRI